MLAPSEESLFAHVFLIASALYAYFLHDGIRTTSLFTSHSVEDSRTINSRGFSLFPAEVIFQVSLRPKRLKLSFTTIT